jgi:hypothetical protein
MLFSFSSELNNNITTLIPIPIKNDNKYVDKKVATKKYKNSHNSYGKQLSRCKFFMEIFLANAPDCINSRENGRAKRAIIKN